MTEPTIERNGKITRYGLACGYIEAYDANGRIHDYFGTDADATCLSYNGSTYDVHTRIKGVTFDNHGYPRRIDGARADWEQFETLAEARAAILCNRKRLTIHHK